MRWIQLGVLLLLPGVALAWDVAPDSLATIGRSDVVVRGEINKIETVERPHKGWQLGKATISVRHWYKGRPKGRQARKQLSFLYWQKTDAFATPHALKVGQQHILGVSAKRYMRESGRADIQRNWYIKHKAKYGLIMSKGFRVGQLHPISKDKRVRDAGKQISLAEADKRIRQALGKR